jgi:hypothetical protein
LRGAGDFLRQLRDDVEGVREIDLKERINRYGLVMEWTANGRGRAHLKPATKLSERQETLLSDLTKRPELLQNR